MNVKDPIQPSHRNFGLLVDGDPSTRVFEGLRKVSPYQSLFCLQYPVWKVELNNGGYFGKDKSEPRGKRARSRRNMV